MTICAVCLLTTSVCARQTFYKTCVGLFLLFGLVLTSLSLTVFYDIPQLNLGLHLHRHRSHNTANIFWAVKYFLQGHIRGGVRGQAATAGGHPVYGQHSDGADPAVPRLGAVQCSTVQYSTVQCSSAPPPVQSQNPEALKDLIICIYLLSINLIHGIL